MKNFTELFDDVFGKTKELIHGSILNQENDHASHILYYLSLFACYLKGPEEAACFKEHWLTVKEDLRQTSDYQDFMGQTRMMEDHIEQSLRSESVHHPTHPDNIGIFAFYENQFANLYEQAKKAKEDFWTRTNARFAYVRRLEEDDDFFFSEAEKNPAVWGMLDP